MEFNEKLMLKYPLGYKSYTGRPAYVYFDPSCNYIYTQELEGSFGIPPSWNSVRRYWMTGRLGPRRCDAELCYEHFELVRKYMPIRAYEKREAALLCRA